MTTRLCTNCKIEKPLNSENFIPRGRNNECYRGMCRACSNQKRRVGCVKSEHLCKTKEEKRDYARQYRIDNKEKISRKRKEHYLETIELQRERSREYFEENKEKIRATQRTEEYRAKRRERRKSNRQNENSYQKNKRQTDHTYNLRCRVSSCISNTLSKRGVSKDHPTWQSLPYSPKDLADHLEKQFDENMNWDNYGSYWHIDHIYPQSLLPYDSLLHENFIKCWALDNLRPLEKIENIKKSNKI